MSHSVTIFLVRHATNPNVGRFVTGWLAAISLNEEGRKQAENLVERLESVPFDAIYSSPLERALETAAPLANQRRLSIIKIPELGEVRYGDWQGHPFAELASVELWRRFNDFRSSTAAPGGELMLETQARMVRGLTAIAAAHPGGSVAVFSHGDAIKSALMHILGIPLDFHLRLEIPPASVSIVEMSPDFARVTGINVLRGTGFVL
jgi:probable phosphoglycerate mutase